MGLHEEGLATHSSLGFAYLFQGKATPKEGTISRLPSLYPFLWVPHWEELVPVSYHNYYHNVGSLFFHMKKKNLWNLCLMPARVLFRNALSSIRLSENIHRKKQQLHYNLPRKLFHQVNRMLSLQTIKYVRITLFLQSCLSK